MIFCEKCRTYPITMRCPEKPRERCEWCWRLWFNEGTKARGRRVRRLAKAAVQRHRRHVRDFPPRPNRRERRRAWRTGLEWRAMDLGLAVRPGEFTIALCSRVVSASHGPQQGTKAHLEEVTGGKVTTDPKRGIVRVEMLADVSAERLAEVSALAEQCAPVFVEVVVAREGEP